jgi:hypothetical protein
MSAAAASGPRRYLLPSPLPDTNPANRLTSRRASSPIDLSDDDMDVGWNTAGPARSASGGPARSAAAAAGAAADPHRFAPVVDQMYAMHGSFVVGSAPVPSDLGAVDGPGTNGYVDPASDEFQDTQFVDFGKDESVLSALECAVCHEIAFKDPIALPCTHRLCRVCFGGCTQSGLHIRSLTIPCPSCRVPCAKTLKEDAFTIEKVIPVLDVKCNYAGCGAVYLYGLRGQTEAAHRAQCAFRPAKCSMDGCTTPAFPRGVGGALMAAHEEDCPFNLMQCPHHNHKVPKCELEAHSGVCEFRMASCDHCSLSMRFNLLAAHATATKNVGPCASFRPCPNGCLAPRKKVCRVSPSAAAAAAAASSDMDSTGDEDSEGEDSDDPALILLGAEGMEAHLAECPNKEVSCGFCARAHKVSDEGTHVHKYRNQHLTAVMKRIEALERQLAGGGSVSHQANPNMRRVASCVLPVRASDLVGELPVPIKSTVVELSSNDPMPRTRTVTFTTRDARNRPHIVFELALRASRAERMAASAAAAARPAGQTVRVWSIKVSQLELAVEQDDEADRSLSGFNMHRSIPRTAGPILQQEFVTHEVGQDALVDVGAVSQFNFDAQYQNDTGCIGLFIELFCDISAVRA